MSISSEVRKAGPFAGNDVATAFPFAFKVFSTADVLVVEANALGAESTLDLGTDYTVSLNADQNASPGGTVTLSAALATGKKLVLSSQVAQLQPVDLTNSGGFYPDVINQALDRATILIQQLAEKVDRAIKVTLTSGLTPDEFVTELQQSASDASASAAAAAASAAAAATFDPALFQTKAHGLGNLVDVLGSTKNKVLNGNFAGNVRQIGASATLSAGAYGHDTWLAGAAGCSFSVSGSTITITAGAYKTVVDGAMITETGNHVLTWPGTAQASINGGAAVSSPAVVALTAGANVSISFGTGTLGMDVQLEEGSTPTASVHLIPALQRFALDYYVKTEYVLIGNGNSRSWLSARGSTALFRPETSVGPMRTVPTVTMINNNNIQYLNTSSVWTSCTMTVACYGTKGALLFYATTNGDGTGTGVYVRRNADGDVVAILSAELS